jgi:hypothetical protein
MAEFGWTYLSRKSLRQAEDQLSGDTQGVRDEIGFLLIHQHYADRFFPGTSISASDTRQEGEQLRIIGNSIPRAVGTRHGSPFYDEHISTPLRLGR